MRLKGPTTFGRWLLIGCIIGGLGLLGVGYSFLVRMGSMIGLAKGDNGIISAVSTLMAWGGMVIASVAMYLVYRYERVGTKSGNRTTVSSALVVARYAINDIGEMVFDYLHPEDDLIYYVRLAFPGGEQREFKCPFEVFSSAGEGMRGTATFEGPWLGMFAPEGGPIP